MVRTVCWCRPSPGTRTPSARWLGPLRVCRSPPVRVSESPASGAGIVALAESTHGRHVSTIDTQEIDREDGHRETRDILLWDLAGQPGYRLIHQLHLDQVAVALVVFDARNETDPFAGVQHWDRALRQARGVQRETTLPLKKLLVAARTDRGGVGVSPE